jgi:hypothetical protein
MKKASLVPMSALALSGCASALSHPLSGDTITHVRVPRLPGPFSGRGTKTLGTITVPSAGARNRLDVPTLQQGDHTL